MFSSLGVDPSFIHLPLSALAVSARPAWVVSGPLRFIAYERARFVPGVGPVFRYLESVLRFGTWLRYSYLASVLWFGTWLRYLRTNTTNAIDEFTADSRGFTKSLRGYTRMYGGFADGFTNGLATDSREFARVRESS